MTRVPQGSSFKGMDREKLLILLKQAQRESACVSREFIVETARSLDMPINEIYGLASFYSFLSTKPQGRNIIRVCKSLPCYLQDSGMIIECVQGVIGVTPGETTADGRFSFELTNCIGACDIAPAMLVNDDVHGHLTPGRIKQILKAYK